MSAHKYLLLIQKRIDLHVSHCAANYTKRCRRSTTISSYTDPIIYVRSTCHFHSHAKFCTRSLPEKGVSSLREMANRPLNYLFVWIGLLWHGQGSVQGRVLICPSVVHIGRLWRVGAHPMTWAWGGAGKESHTHAPVPSESLVCIRAARVFRTCQRKKVRKLVLNNIVLVWRFLLPMSEEPHCPCLKNLTFSWPRRIRCARSRDGHRSLEQHAYSLYPYKHINQ